MEKDELETTVDDLEQEVLDEIENPYKPYSVTFPYEVRLTIPDDGHNTEITIRTRSEEVRLWLAGGPRNLSGCSADSGGVELV